MKKRITRKLMATVTVALLFAGGAIAQTHDGTDLEGDGGTFGVNWADNVTEAHVIAGHSIPLFAMPDDYFHPNYNPATQNYTLTDGFTWVWTQTSGAAGDITFTPAAPAEDNYVLISAGALASGAYTVHAVETAPAAWGSCAGAGEDITVNVYAEPDATMGATLSYAGCEADVAATVVEATISGGFENYWLVWSLQIYNLTDLGAIYHYFNNAKADQGAGAMYAEEFTTTTPDKTQTASGAYDITVTGGFTALDGRTTIYTYALTSINDRALRFSDFNTLNGDATDESLFTYNAIGETLTVTVYPTPTTGPIYHINNTWAD
jgi:hypothetical protein